MSLRTVIDAELSTLGDIRLFDVHSHTGTDVDGISRTCEEQVDALEALGGRSAATLGLARLDLVLSDQVSMVKAGDGALREEIA